MENIPSQEQLGNEWAEILIMRWKERMHELKVGRTGELENSFAYQVMLDQLLNLKKIDLGFLYYGKFTDMGVGKGMGIESVKDNGKAWASGLNEKNRRRPKKWYSKTFTREYNVLVELLAKYYQNDILNNVVTELKNQA